MIRIFGYGSLMWNPDFAYEAREPALLRGYHRRFCLKSIINRGTPEEPGMMLGLMPGGTCTGVAYRVGFEDREDVLDKLDEREGEGRANRRVLLPVRILNQPGKVLENAWAYIPIVSYQNYMGMVGRKRMVELIAVGDGKTGSSHDYLRHLMAEVSKLKVEEPALKSLLEKVDHYKANERAENPPAMVTP